MVQSHQNVEQVVKDREYCAKNTVANGTKMFWRKKNNQREDNKYEKKNTKN